MGRGRNKAKAKKVARDLKYNTDGVDFRSLEEELHNQARSTGPESSDSDQTGLEGNLQEDLEEDA